MKLTSGKKLMLPVSLSTSVKPRELWFLPLMIREQASAKAVALPRRERSD